MQERGGGLSKDLLRLAIIADGVFADEAGHTQGRQAAGHHGHQRMKPQGIQEKRRTHGQTGAAQHCQHLRHPGLIIDIFTIKQEIGRAHV